MPTTAKHVLPQPATPWGARHSRDHHWLSSSRDPYLLLSTLTFSTHEQHFCIKTVLLSRPGNSPVFPSLAIIWDWMTKWIKDSCVQLQECQCLPPRPVQYINSGPPHTRRRSLPPHVPGVAGTTLHHQLKAWQPYRHTLGKPQHNEVTHRSTKACGSHALRPITLEMVIKCGSKSTYHFYSMSFASVL